jgi:hypothetical protein
MPRILSSVTLLQLPLESTFEIPAQAISNSDLSLSDEGTPL